MSAFPPESEAKSSAESQSWRDFNQLKIKVESLVLSFYCECVKVAAAKAQKGEAQLLDQATGNLLRAVKQKMLKKRNGVEYDKLRKDGYGDRFLGKLEKA